MNTQDPTQEPDDRHDNAPSAAPHDNDPEPEVGDPPPERDEPPGDEAPGDERPGHGPAPPPPPRPPRPGPLLPPRNRRLDRRSENRVLAGVAGGLGDYFGVDPAIFRLAFVALAIFGGSGFILYALGWIFLPVRGTTGSLGDDLVRRVGGGRSAGGLVLIVIAALVIIANTRILQGGLVWAAILIGIGVLLFRSGSDDDGSDGGPDGPDPGSAPGRWSETADPHEQTDTAVGSGVGAEPPPASQWTSPGSATTTAPVQPRAYTPPPRADDGWRPTPQVAPPESPRPPSVLGRATVAATLVLIGFVALLENLTPVDLGAAHYLALSLTVVGGGLIVGAWFGRARGLIALGILGVLGLAAVTATPTLPPGGVGDRVFRPQTVADLRQPYGLGVGEMTIDLTELDVTPGQDVAVAADMGIGSLQVEVPDDVGVIVDAETQLGDIDVFDQPTAGDDQSVTIEVPGEEGSATFALDLSVSVGEIVVDRATAGAEEGTS